MSEARFLKVEILVECPSGHRATLDTSHIEESNATGVFLAWVCEECPKIKHPGFRAKQHPTYRVTI